MWESVLLNGKYSLALLKAAKLTGDIKLIEPTTASEKKQIDQVQKQINHSRFQDASLIYCLLADTVYLDRGNFGWEIFEDLSDEPSESEEINLKSRFLLSEVSSDFRSFIGPTDSSRNFLAVHKQELASNQQDVANRIAALEPLIWRSFENDNIYLERKELRLVLDLVMFAPNLIRLYRSAAGTRLDRSILQAAARKWPHIRLTKEQQRRLCNLLSIALTKGNVASHQLAEAERLNAVYPIDNLTFGKNRYPRDMTRLESAKSEDLVAAARVFLKEVRFWPVADGFADVLRLRHDKDFTTFRENLRLWTTAIVTGDFASEAKLRREIQKANESLSKATTCSDIGGLFTYLGLPLMFLDMLVAPVFGAPLTVAGFGLQAYSDWLKKKHRWTIIGRG